MSNKMSVYALATKEELIAIAIKRDELGKQNKALREELEQARESLEKGEKYKKALEEIGSGRCMAHFEYCDIARAALK